MSSPTLDRPRIDRWAKGCTLAVAIGTGGSAWLGAAAWVLHREARLPQDTPATPCPVLVLGCRPGPALDARVHGAAELYHGGLADCVIISGRGESNAGARTAQQMGVPASSVHQESNARSTWENLALSASFLPEARLWIATDRWHMPRALWFATRLDLRAYPCPIDRSSSRRTLAVAREGMSVLHAAVRRGGERITGRGGPLRRGRRG